MTVGPIVFHGDELRRLLASDQVAKVLTAKALRVEAIAKRLCPVDTGRLRASITSEVGKDSDGLYAVVGSDVEYAGYVEFGTSRNAAQPYLRPALAEVEGQERGS